MNCDPCKPVLDAWNEGMSIASGDHKDTQICGCLLQLQIISNQDEFYEFWHELSTLFQMLGLHFTPDTF